MKEERLKVLKMIEDGKITAEEASKLLESLKGTRVSHENFQDFEAGLNKFSHEMSSWAVEISKKINSTFKDMEPRMKEIAKTVVGKTADVAENISKTLNESLKKCPDDCCNESDACNDPGCNDTNCNDTNCKDPNCKDDDCNKPKKSKKSNEDKVNKPN